MMKRSKGLYSIRTNLILMFCVSVLGVYLLLVITGILFLDAETDRETDRTLDMMLHQKARELDANFEGMERALDTLEGYIVNNADTTKMKYDEAYQTTYLANFEHLARDVSAVAGNVYAFYFRTDPTKYKDFTGIFVTEDGYGGYVSVEPTVIEAYNENDREHVAWYYEPIKNGRPIWLEPYMNKNINVYMTSYVSPVYVDGKLLGVVGMDLDMTIIQEIVDSIDYADGVGYLLAPNGDIVYSEDHPEGLKAMYLDDEYKEARLALMGQWERSDGSNSYLWTGKEHRYVTKKLRNGMILAIVVSEAEIDRPVHNMIKNMLAVLIIVLILLILVTWRIHKEIISPIRRLTDASSRIAKGELNTQIEYHSRSEIGELSDSINSIARELREYFSYIHSQAYTDGMTGVGNKTSYLDQVKNLERKIQAGMAAFSVIVFDMNGLKSINDRLGHEVGDAYITTAAELIKKSVGAQHVYRIGGDEFIVVMENFTKEKTDALVEELKENIKKLNEDEKYRKDPLAVSMGAAVYDPETDPAYKDVFKRADEMMYQNKAEYYRGKFDRRKV